MTKRKIKAISLLLTDDDPIMRAGLRAVLARAEDINIVGEARDGFEAQQMVGKLKPKILLLDLKMPGLSPAMLEKWVRENSPETITLVLTAHDRDAYLTSMMEAGAAGYMEKGESTERLIDAIRRAAQGEIVFNPEQFARARHWKETVNQKMDSLTEREREVLNLMAQGLNNKTIAKNLSISNKTAAFHVSRILEKLEVDTKQQAVAWIHTHLSDTLDSSSDHKD